MKTRRWTSSAKRPNLPPQRSRGEQTSMIFINFQTDELFPEGCRLRNLRAREKDQKLYLRPSSNIARTWSTRRMTVRKKMYTKSSTPYYQYQIFLYQEAQTER